VRSPPGSTLGTLGGLASRVMSFVGRLSKRPLSVPLLALTVCRWRFLERNTSDNLSWTAEAACGSALSRGHTSGEALDHWPTGTSQGRKPR
jgi:hypothetical protein